MESEFGHMGGSHKKIGYFGSEPYFLKPNLAVATSLNGFLFLNFHGFLSGLTGERREFTLLKQKSRSS